MAGEDYKKIFATNLKYYMTLNDKTQMDLMNDLHLSSSTVSNWCTGLKLPRMDKVQMLADYFHINKSDLIEEKTKEQKQAERDERDIAKDLQNIMDKLKQRGNLDQPVLTVKRFRKKPRSFSPSSLISCSTILRRLIKKNTIHIKIKSRLVYERKTD